MALDGILHIQQAADLVAHRLAIFQRDAILVVDIDAQQSIGGPAAIFHAHQLVTQTGHRRLDQLSQLRWLLGHTDTTNKKWALGPLR
jgi:hypothetical protein